MVPKSIDTVTISANIPFGAGTILPGFSNADRHGLSELNADIVMLDGSTQLPAIVIEGFLCAEIAGASASAITKSLTGKLTWKPSISLLALEDLSSILSRLPNGEAKLTEVWNKGLNLDVNHLLTSLCSILSCSTMRTQSWLSLK
jgi:hypothetical protein